MAFATRSRTGDFSIPYRGLRDHFATVVAERVERPARPRSMRQGTQLTRAVLAVLSLGALLFMSAACADDPGAARSTTQDSAPRQAAPEGDYSGNRAAGGSGGSGGSDTGAGRQATGTDVTKIAPTADPADTARAIVYTADLRVRAKNVDTGAALAKQFVAAAGGHVANESSSTRPPNAMVVFRIPAEKYNTVLDQLSNRVGTRLSLRQQAEDVTAEVADVASRVKSAESTLASFRKLLNRANTIGEVLNVEQEISRREADLEALQARQKSLARQTRFATVTMQIEGPEHTVRTEPREGGFLGGLKSGWAAFTGLLSGLALVFGWLLPFTPIVAVIVAVALWLRRRQRGTHPPGPSAQA